MRSQTAALIALLLLTGCVSLTPQAQAIRVTNNPDVVRGCKFLGNVRDDGANAVGTATRVEDMLKKRAAALGGNVLMVTSTTATPYVTTMSGEAYSCPAP